MKLYARRSSSNSQKVLWFLEELGLNYEFVATGGDAGGLDAPSYRELNPNGQVPTWTDEHGSVWESHTILRYLAAQYGPQNCWPGNPWRRSELERWMDWSQASFDEAFMSLFWAYWRTPVSGRSEKFIARQLAASLSAVKTLETALAKQEFLGGAEFSIADVPAGSLMYRYVQLDITDELPATVHRWYERLTQRPAYQTHVMIPFDELKGRLAH